MTHNEKELIKLIQEAPDPAKAAQTMMDMMISIGTVLTPPCHSPGSANRISQ